MPDFQMRTIVHLSDLHFGRVDHSLLAPLLESVAQIGPDLVAVSGDLTQRAKAEQFRQARRFLDALPAPQIIVPGNHDIPLYNVADRFLKPLENYRRHITDNLQPFYQDEEMAVLGLNTARSLAFKEGRLSRAQTEQARSRLCALSENVTKIVVTHHPFELPAGHEGKLVGRSRMVMKTLAECRTDILLSGHLHIGNTAGTAARYKIAGHAAVVVQAGTATSTRGRGETNSFNVLRIEARDFLTVERWSWQPARNAFTVSLQERFRQAAEGWTTAGGEMLFG